MMGLFEYFGKSVLSGASDEGPGFGQKDLRQVQGHPPKGVVRVICENQRHKQRQG